MSSENVQAEVAAESDLAARLSQAVDLLRSPEPVEFPEPRAREEGIPLTLREPQDRTFRVPAVADTDRAAR